MKKETKEFCEIATIRSEKFNPLNTNEIRKCIELEHISQETGTLLGYVDSNKQKSIKNVFHKGDVLFGKLRPYLKKYILADFDGVCSSEIWVLKPQKEINSSYLFQLIQTSEFIQIANVSCGSKMPRADWDYIKNQTFEVLPPSEQTKIANFLTAVDKKIAGLENQIALQEQYKSGMMQRIFSQEIRFKPFLSEAEGENGEDYSEWEEKLLKEVAVKKSSNISANKIEENFGEYIIYGASGVLKNVDFYEEENDYISIVKDGAGVGRLLYCKGKSSVLGTMEIIKPKIEINTYFLYCLLSKIDFVKYVTGSTIPHIYFKDYSHEICGIPSLAEQTKIANFLSSLDTKISATRKQVEIAKEWKKGLLQQMFVSNDAVEGTKTVVDYKELEVEMLVAAEK